MYSFIFPTLTLYFWHFKKKLYLFIYLWLHWVSIVASKGYSLVVVHGLIAVASLVEHGSRACWLQELLHSGSVVAATGLQHTGSTVAAHGVNCCVMWNLPGPGIEPVSPELGGGFFTTELPGKALYFWHFYVSQIGIYFSLQDDSLYIIKIYLSLLITIL